LRWIEIVARPEIDEEQNRVVNIIGAVKDITERKEAETKLQTLSMHDQLTGLYNRGYFEESMQQLERGRQFPNSILMADVDDLKVTNDRDGHAAGDELLKRTAQVLTKAFRAEDVIARIGGDEFVVLLPGLSAVEAETALQRFIHFLDEDNSRHTDSPLKISYGICTAEKSGSLVETLKEADANMYLEKQSRNLKSR
jgi:diguanylate cyclase (GGDEF)-like protein